MAFKRNFLPCTVAPAHTFNIFPHFWKAMDAYSRLQGLLCRLLDFFSPVKLLLLETSFHLEEEIKMTRPFVWRLLWVLKSFSLQPCQKTEVNMCVTVLLLLVGQVVWDLAWWYLAHPKDVFEDVWHCCGVYPSNSCQLFCHPLCIHVQQWLIKLLMPVPVHSWGSSYMLHILCPALAGYHTAVFYCTTIWCSRASMAHLTNGPSH